MRSASLTPDCNSNVGALLVIGSIFFRSFSSQGNSHLSSQPAFSHLDARRANVNHGLSRAVVKVHRKPPFDVLCAVWKRTRVSRSVPSKRPLTFVRNHGARGDQVMDGHDLLRQQTPVHLAVSRQQPSRAVLPHNRWSIRGVPDTSGGNNPEEEDQEWPVHSHITEKPNGATHLPPRTAVVERRKNNRICIKRRAESAGSGEVEPPG
jgi:hypothetical protein